MSITKGELMNANVKKLFNELTMELALNIEREGVTRSLVKFNSLIQSSLYPELPELDHKTLVTRLKEEAENIANGNKNPVGFRLSKATIYKLRVIAFRSDLSLTESIERMISETEKIEIDVRLV